jgi:hypothetical protein
VTAVELLCVSLVEPAAHHGGKIIVGTLELGDDGATTYQTLLLCENSAAELPG